MEAWLEHLIKQCILYSLPVLISLTSITIVESRTARRPVPHPFYSIHWTGSWLPFLAAIVFFRGVIIALPQPLQSGSRAAMYRCLTHLTLCMLGFLLYSWSLKYPPLIGSPPLHHWWAKLFMFYNLCMACMHLLPLPGQWLGELLTASKYGAPLSRLSDRQSVGIYTLLAASPLIDLLLGETVIYPVYTLLANMAEAL
ncbi:MAG: hypothetical protein RQ867_07925 [Mariprofundaceae bacterium]|nr:hypothetical protein [Mariprofundaceae bacterium]